MKKIRNFTLVCAAFALLVGCEEQTDTFELRKEDACVSQKGVQTCEKHSSFTRLSVKDGKAVVQPIDVPDNAGKLSFPQFGEAAAFEEGTYNLNIAETDFSLQKEASSLSAPLQPGILFRKSKKGQFQAAVGSAAPLGVKHYPISPNGYFTGLALARATKVVYSTPRPILGLQMATLMVYAQQDELSRIMEGDTGTEVVILDDFSPSSGDCSAEAPEGCCPPGEGGGDPMLDISEWVDDFAANGDDLMACFKIGSICLFTDGSQLIILVCDSQVRYCLDFSICPVTVTTSSEFGICISVPLECGITNPF